MTFLDALDIYCKYTYWQKKYIFGDNAEISRNFFSIGGASYLRIDLVGDAPIVQETMATPMIEKSTESSLSINLDDDPTKNGFLHQNDSDRLLELINSPPPSMVSSGILL